MSSRKRPARVESILGPVLALLQHSSAITLVQTHLQRLTRVLATASITTRVNPFQLETEGAASVESLLGDSTETVPSALKSSGSLTIHLPQDAQETIHYTTMTSLAAPFHGSQVAMKIGDHAEETVDMDDVDQSLDLGVAPVLERAAGASSGSQVTVTLDQDCLTLVPAQGDQVQWGSKEESRQFWHVM